ncbi:Putative dihydroflavonol 4-reductase [Linum perenne]
MKIVVTGASGYLGGRLCHVLLQRGHAVRALVRRTSDLSSLPAPAAAGVDFELAYGDVTDYSSLIDAFDGCNIVFHAAAVVEPWLPDPSKFFSRHHEKFFCSEYERSKADADKVALQAASEGVPIVVVYPGVVYGPGKLTTGNVVAKLLIERFQGRLPGYIGSGYDRYSFSHVDDVVQGHVAAMEKGQIGERYLLTGENASFKQVFDMAAVITGTSKPKINIPLWVIEVYGWLMVLVSRITGKLPLISPPTVRVLRHQWAYSCEKAKKDLGYNPRSLKDGLLEVLPWLKSLGVIKY